MRVIENRNGGDLIEQRNPGHGGHIGSASGRHNREAPPSRRSMKALRPDCPLPLRAQQLPLALQLGERPFACIVISAEATKTLLRPCNSVGKQIENNDHASGLIRAELATP